MIEASFFRQDPQKLAVALLGKVLRHRVGDTVLAAMIVETEAYYLTERGSHSSLGRTPSREPMFQAAGTLYMYYARGGDSLNISAEGEGNAVLIKAGVPFLDERSGQEALEAMHARNPLPSGQRRPDHRLCAGQTLLCRALGLRVPDWTGRRFVADTFYLDDVGATVARVIRARRLGIAHGRDAHLPLRFIHHAYAHACTRNPLTRRTAIEGVDYWVLTPETAPGRAPAVASRDGG